MEKKRRKERRYDKLKKNKKQNKKGEMARKEGGCVVAIVASIGA